MAVAADSFASTPGLHCLTLAKMRLWGWADGSLRCLTALTRLELIGTRLEYVPPALADARHTLKALVMELADSAMGSVLTRQTFAVLVCLGRLELLHVTKVCDRFATHTAWGKAEAERLRAFPVAFLAVHPGRRKPPLPVQRCSHSEFE